VTTANATPNAADPGGEPRQRVVLYVEDDEANIALIRRVLSLRPAITLHTAMTGKGGLAAATALHPDLILLDNRLPDASGSEILAVLGAAQDTAAIPVIVLTGDTGRSMAERLIGAGASGYLAKPFDLNDFLTLVDQYLPR
jgi:CheY-like chemotaxis protein